MTDRPHRNGNSVIIFHPSLYFYILRKVGNPSSFGNPSIQFPQKMIYRRKSYRFGPTGLKDHFHFWVNSQDFKYIIKKCNDVAFIFISYHADSMSQLFVNELNNVKQLLVNNQQWFNLCSSIYHIKNKMCICWYCYSFHLSTWTAHWSFCINLGNVHVTC